MPQEVTPATVAAQRAAGEPVTVLDVREGWELAVVSVPGAVHIPLGQLPARVGELDREGRYAVLCHHGGRSAQATAFLQRQGFAQAVNIAGGIDAWAETVDPGMARY